jgi:aminopeptidase N
MGLVAKLPNAPDLAQWDQVMNVFDYINRLLINQPIRDKFQIYALSVLGPVFDELGWDPKADESPNTATLRGNLIESLGELGDEEIIAGARERFHNFLADPKSLPPDMRRSVFSVVASDADEATWSKLHDLGLKTTVIAEKQDYYDALAHACNPKLVQKTLATALTDELSSSRAAFLPGHVARDSEHPELAWDFAKANMKVLLGKTDALNVNSYAPSLFTFFSDVPRIAELKAYAKANLPASSAREVNKAVEEVAFRAEFKKKISSQLDTALPP